MGNFWTDVIQRDSRYRRVERCADPEFLEPVTRAHALALLAELGPGWMLYETMRSPLRQRALFARGATDLRELGVHATGLAFDIVRNDAPPGKKPHPSWRGDFSPLVQAAIARGLVAGLRRKNGTLELTHVQRVHVRDQKRLLAGEWYPDGDYVAKSAESAGKEKR